MEPINFTAIDKEGTISNVYHTRDQLLVLYPSIGRNFHMIDVSDEFDISNMIARNGVILLKLDKMRCLITRDVVLLPTERDGDEGPREEIRRELPKLIQKELVTGNQIVAPEFRILEAIFRAVVNLFDGFTKHLMSQFPIHSWLNKMDQYDQMNHGKTIVSTHFQIINLTSRIRDISDHLRDILEGDHEKFKDFYLSYSYSEADTALYELLETYQKHFEENLDTLTKFREKFDIVMEIVSVNLDKQRTRLARVGLDISIVTLAITVANVISSSFGMNLKSGLEQSDWAFWSVFAILIVVAVVVALVCRRWARDS